MPALAPMLHCFVKKERRGAKNPILETNHHWVKTNHPGRRHSEEQQKYNRAMSDDTGSERGTQNFCSQTSYHQSLSQLRDKIHLSSTSHHKPGCGCSRMPSDGHGRERGELRESLCQPPALLLVLITEQKHLRTDSRRVVSAEAAANATQQRAAESR